jgi:hypothetical protein
MLRARPVLRLARLTTVLCAAVALGAPAAHAATPAVNIDAPSDQRVDQALATGAKIVRLFVNWNQLEPNGPGFPSTDPGAANALSQYDTAIRRLNASGAKPMFVILGTPTWANGSTDDLVPPTDPQTYASFFGKFVRHTQSVGSVAAYEVWNEEDAAEFWHGPNPGAAAYAPMLRAAYAAAKPVAGDAAILVGPTTGNNASFVQGLYDLGLKGSFDGVAVHTDTACLSLGPDFYYREDPGARLGQYTFLGYRAIRDVMVANNDPDPRIWMTEMGWSSTNGGPTSCQRGTGAGKRPSGVSEATQAAFLTQAYGCLARDPYVAVGAWFTLSDARRYTPDEINHYGLLDVNGAPKPSYAAFKQVTAAGGGTAGPCGDFTPPTVSFISPTPNQGFTGSLLIQATATDGADPGVTPAGLNRISYLVDGQPAFYRFNDLRAVGDTVSLNWLRAADLSDGPHTITAEATDQLGNVARTTVTVMKGAQYVGNVSYATAFKIASPKGRPSCRGRLCTLKGRLTGPANQSLSGRVRIEWQLLVRMRVKSLVKGQKRYVTKWVTFHKGGSSAMKPFTFTQRLKRSGKWRVHVYYEGAPPLKASKTPWISFSA